MKAEQSDSEVSYFKPDKYEILRQVIFMKYMIHMPQSKALEKQKVIYYQNLFTRTFN